MESLSSSDGLPLLEVQLELAGSDVAWAPEVGEAATGASSARSLVLGWVKSFFAVGTLVQRLGADQGGRRLGQGAGG